MINYYHILGITERATIDQIKKAYRRKAFQLHPDRNKSANAQEEFILLNEAYEYLLKTQGTHFDPVKRAQEQTQKKAAYQRYWEEKEREEARARAQKYAQMKYEAYLKSDIYKTTEAINIVVDLFITTILLLIIVVLPILIIRQYGIAGILYAATIIVPTSPLWFRYFLNALRKIKDINEFNPINGPFKTKVTTLILSTVLNLFLIFRIALYTFIALKYLIAIYTTGIIIGFIISYFVKQKYHKFLIRYTSLPLCINIFFLINYIFSSNTTIENHIYSYPDRFHSPIFTTIHMEDNAFEQYHGIRIIFNGENVRSYGNVTYKIADGCLGYKVAKSIVFEE